MDSPKPEHAKLSPSGASKWMACPLSLKLEETLPPDTTLKPAADYGSMCHRLSEDYLNATKDYKKRLGEKLYGQVVDQEALDVVETYTDYCNSIINNHIFTGSFQVEGQVDLSSFAISEVYGTADFILKDEIEKVAYIVDLKAGRGVKVSPENNPQLKIYTLGALGDDLHKFDTIHMVIVQPRGGGETVKDCTITPKELQEFMINDLTPAVFAIGSESEESSPSESTCRWCRAKGICKPFHEASLLEAKEVFSINTPEKKAVPAIVNIMSPQKIMDIYSKLPLLSMFTKSVEARAFEITESGLSDNYKLVKGRNKRDWRDKDEVVKFCAGKNIEPYEPGKFLTPAKLEKLVGKAKSELKSMIVNKAGKPVIALKTDKREAVNNLETIFTKE